MMIGFSSDPLTSSTSLGVVPLCSCSPSPSIAAAAVPALLATTYGGKTSASTASALANRPAILDYSTSTAAAPRGPAPHCSILKILLIKYYY